MGLFSLFGSRSAGRRPVLRPRPQLRLEALEDRRVPATFLVVAPNLANNQTSFADINVAIAKAAAGDTVQIEQGAVAPTPAAGATIANITVNKAITVQADVAFGPNNTFEASYTLSTSKVVLNNLNIGSVTINDSQTGETIENSIIHSDADKHYGILEAAALVANGANPPVGTAGTNGSNTIIGNRFLTTQFTVNVALGTIVPEAANIILQPPQPDAANKAGTVTNDQVLNNTFFSIFSTIQFPNAVTPGVQPIPPNPVKGFSATATAFITANEETAGLKINGNTFIDNDTGNAGGVNIFSTGVSLTDDVGDVSSNYFELGPAKPLGTVPANPDGVCIAIADNGTATPTITLTLDHNNFNTNFQGTGVLSNRSNNGSIYSVELSDNNFVSNLVGLDVRGDKALASTDFGIVDAGGGTLKSTGGNDFAQFTGGPQNFAIITTDGAGNPGTPPTVQAQNNQFGGFTPSGVISVGPGTAVVSSPFVTGFPATLQSVFHDQLGRSPSAADVTAFTPFAGNILAVANGVVFSPEHFTVVVNSLFFELLGRGADAGGLNAYVAFLKAGGTEEQVIGSLVSSQEYFNRAQQTNPGGDQNTAWVNSLYSDLLGRAGSASDVAAWVSAVQKNGLGFVALRFLQGTEFRLDQVNAFYGTFPVGVVVGPNLLHRSTAPAPAEANAWANSTLSLFAIEVRIMATAEFANNG